MLELKITGNTPQELVVNVLQLAGVLLNGAKNTAQKPDANLAQRDAEARQRGENVDGSQRRETVAEAEPLQNPKAVDTSTDAPAKTHKKRGRKSNAEKAAAKTAEKPAELPVGGDAIPDFLDRTKPKGEAPKVESVGYTEQDCRGAVLELYENFERRARDAGVTDETEIMNTKVAYAKKLVAKFGVQKITELKPEQYDDFVAAAQPFIDGTAE